jgi:hypothetical protein
MAETNGDIPLSGYPRVDAALKRIRGKFQDLEDAMLVQAHLEKRAGERMKEHAELLADHDEWMRRHEAFRQEHEEWIKHFDAKLDALTNFLIRREGGPEAG